MKKIVIVAYYFPPVAASGAMRPLAFSRYLEKYGWLSRVITADANSVFPRHSIDPELLKSLPASVRVDALPHGNPVQRLLAWRSKAKGWIGRSKTLHADGKGQGDSTPSPSSDGDGNTIKRLVLDWMFEFPDPQCAWLRAVIAHGKTFSKDEIPDVVWATGGPWTALLAGKRLAELWNVPFIADYRDPWTSNPYVSYPSPWLNRKARQLEAAVGVAANRIVTNTRELRLQLVRDYPEVAHKILTITNGYDPTSFSTVARRQDSGAATGGESKGSALELCHFGTVYGKRTPVALLEAISELHVSGRLTPSQLQLRFIGAWDGTEEKCERLARQLEAAGLLKREGSIPYRACLQRMANTDVLLVIQPDSPLQIPGKIYEYIASRRPLLLIGGEGATANLVKDHSLGVACANRVDQIRRLILDVVEGRESLRAPEPEAVEQFDYSCLTGDLAEILEKAVTAVSDGSLLGKHKR